MKIRGAVGLFITIIILKFLMSSVFVAFESTIIKAFGLANTLIDQTQIRASTGNLTLPLPRVTSSK